jgi:hypothetical protein
MISTLWFSPDWAEGLLVAAAIVFVVFAVLELVARATVPAILLPVGLALVTLALLAF